ncbi:MAG: sigma 54-interacting transcriptional regulator [Rubrivivax sp.]|nr:sigma 54-interacting transcriptional regulator [Rubrivivax sp.]
MSASSRPDAADTAGTRARVLIVDDDADLLRLLGMRLTAAGYRVAGAESAEDALRLLATERPQLVISDVQLPGADGLALFERIRERHPALPVILLTAHGTIPDAVEATARGVFTYLTKPFDGKLLLQKVGEALALSTPPADDDAAQDWREGIVSRSARMADLLAETRLVAASDASVLIRGESGTGKELLAQAIHRASARAGRPFVAINCSAIPETLLESELFGHVKGAFTGAARDHRGLFQAADGGTLFLDEIGDMPPALQVKLLRVLQERSVRPVGSTTPVAIDVRVVSATHRDLEAMLADGSFREDLFYRLAVVTLTLPTLAERREDIPLLAQHFLAALSARHGRRVNGFAPDALWLLATAAWPGNVRQLHNVVEQVVALATTPLVPAALVQRALRVPGMQVLSYAEARRRFEHDYLVDLLKLTDGNVADAARLAERNRTEFYRLLQKHGLTPGRFRGDVADDEEPVADRRQ